MIKNIPISVDFNAIQREAELSALNKAKTILGEQLNIMFKNGRTTWTSPEGVGHEIIRKKVEEFILSDKFSETVDRLVEEHFETQAAEAVKTLLNSRSRKYMFEPIEHKP